MEEQPEVDEHAHANEEVGDEDGVARELQSVHQWRHMWDVAVHDQSCEECTYDAFQTHRLAEGRTHEKYRHDEDELHHGIAIASQEPSRQTRDGQQQHDSKDGELRQEPHPEEESTARLVCRHQCCQADECQ